MRQKRVFSVNFSITAKEERSWMEPPQPRTMGKAQGVLPSPPWVPLTSPQGVLGVLGHGIGFVQDDELEAFPEMGQKGMDLVPTPLQELGLEVPPLSMAPRNAPSSQIPTAHPKTTPRGAGKPT